MTTCRYYPCCSRQERLWSVLLLFAAGSLYWQSKVLDLDGYASVKNKQQQQQIPCRLLHQNQQRVFPNVTIISTKDKIIRDDNDNNKCDLTAVLFDPSLPVAEASSPIWGALESVLFHATGNVCLVLQTSACIMIGTNHQHPNPKYYDAIWAAISSRIPSHAILLKAVFQAGSDNHDEGGSSKWITTPQGRGTARISVVNHKKYNLLSCSNFWSPSNAWMNLRYWQDEFTEQDSDMILVVQDDTVLCQTLNVPKIVSSRAKPFAYLGGPWPNKRDGTGLQVCTRMELLWRRWNSLGDIRSTVLGGWWKTGHDCHFGQSINPVAHYGPAGNGGLSLRSRTWMIKAIEHCPHAKYSGLSAEALALHSSSSSSSCVVGAQSNFLDTLNAILQPIFGPRFLIYEETGRSAPEDVYFTTVLRGMGAPMPSAFEAALFATELLFPDQIANDWYGPTDLQTQETKIHEMMVPGPAVLYWLEEQKASCLKSEEDKYDMTQHLLPMGMHKVWRYHEPEFLLGVVRNNVCPHLRYIYPLQEIPGPFQEEAMHLGIITR